MNLTGVALGLKKYLTAELYKKTIYTLMLSRGSVERIVLAVATAF